MKTKISKREVMNEAWGLYRLGKGNMKFGYFLKKAWAMVKERVSYYSNRNNYSGGIYGQPVKYVSPISGEAYDNFYVNTKYFGD